MDVHPRIRMRTDVVYVRRDTDVIYVRTGVIHATDVHVRRQTTERQMGLHVCDTRNPKPETRNPRP
jgi:hypothetical protein